MPGMLRLEFDVNVAVPRHRPDALGVVRLERLSIAEELVEPDDGALQIADGNTSEQVDVHGLLLARVDRKSAVNSSSNFPGRHFRCVRTRKRIASRRLLWCDGSHSRPGFGRSLAMRAGPGIRWGDGLAKTCLGTGRSDPAAQHTACRSRQ